MTVDDGWIFQVFAKDKMRFKALVKLRESAKLIAPDLR
ncbi:hypothetical protein J2Z50_006627 [Ensifer mexicanus]|nr:hypothetical protein [Sinorhizobium mexicanum]